MLRGVCFECNNSSDFFAGLGTIMDVGSYEWYIDDVDLNHYIFKKVGRYGGLEFKNTLHELSILSFVRIRRYPIGASIDSISTYEEYAKSDCDVLILFYDGGFCEVYEKEEELIRKTFQFCMEKGFEKVDYIDSATDVRHRMHF